MNDRGQNGWSKPAAFLHQTIAVGRTPLQRTRVVTNKSGKISDDTLAVLTRLVRLGVV